MFYKKNLNVIFKKIKIIYTNKKISIWIIELFYEQISDRFFHDTVGTYIY